MTTFVATDSVVYHIEPDQYVPGNILFSDSHSLKTTDGTTTSLIAGSSSSGYSMSSGSSARFRDITGFHQVTSTRVFLVDTGNHCMRMLDRTSNASYVSYAGRCCTRSYADGTSSARFYYPRSAIADKKASGRLLVTDRNYHAIRHVYTSPSSGSYHYVTTFFRSSSSIYPRGITQESSSGDLFITSDGNYNIYRLSYTSKTLTLVSGISSSGFHDGYPCQTRFHNPYDLLLLGPHTLLIADVSNNRLRLLDLISFMTISLCSGAATTTDGNLTACTIRSPYSVTAIHDSLFIGQYQAIRMIKGLMILFYALDKNATVKVIQVFRRS